MINPNEMKQKSSTKLDFDLFKLTATQMSVSISSADKSIVPEGLLTELDVAEKKDKKTKAAFKQLNIDHYQREFDRKQLELQSESYNLVVISGFALELLLGRKDNKKAKKYLLYDIYTVNFNLGNYAFNLEMTNLNYFVQMLTHFSDTMLTSHISDFRPLIKPISDKEVRTLKEKMGNKFGTDEEAILKEMRKHIVRDYYRLLFYTNLYRKYGHLTSLDVKRRLIWTFKRSSVMYQLISGKTLKEIISEEDKFLRHEFKYLEKQSAIELNNKLMQGEWFDFDVTDISDSDQRKNNLSYFQKHLASVKNKFQGILDYQIDIKLTFSMSLSLIKLSQDDQIKSQHTGKRKQKYRLLKELDTNLNNCVFELKKPLGPLQATLDFNIESLEVRFREEIPNYQKSLHLNQQIIEEYLQSPTFKKK